MCLYTLYYIFTMIPVIKKKRFVEASAELELSYSVKVALNAFC